MTAAGIVFSNLHDNSVSELTQSRTMASVPFCGRYRLIDFVLSNMVNSGIFKVGVITKSNYQSLMDHIGSGKDWDLSRKNKGIILLPPFGREDSNTLYKTRLEALKGILGFISKCKEEYMVLTDCDKVLNIDIDKVLKFHQNNLADLTVVYKKQHLNSKESIQHINYILDGNRVTGVNIKHGESGEKNICLDIFVLKRELLLNLISAGIEQNAVSFHRDVLKANVNSLKILGYEFEGYCAKIDSLVNYYKYNMDMLNKENRDKVFKIDNMPVFTKVRDSAPTHYGKNCKVKNSLIADGCEIYGSVENSILFRGVKISKGTKVINSILMQDTITGENVSLNCVITDKNVVIRDRRVLSGCEELPFFIGKSLMI